MSREGLSGEFTIADDILIVGNGVTGNSVARKFCRGDKISYEILSLYFNVATVYPRTFCRV